MQVNSIGVQNFNGGIYASEGAHSVLQNALKETLNNNIGTEVAENFISKYNKCLNAKRHDIRIQYRGEFFSPAKNAVVVDEPQLLSKVPELYFCDRVRMRNFPIDEIAPPKNLEQGDVFISVKDTATGKVTCFKDKNSILESDNMIHNLMKALDFVIKREKL